MAPHRPTHVLARMCGQPVTSRPGRYPSEPGVPGGLSAVLSGGGTKKRALKASMLKLLTILNAILKSGTPWRMAARPTTRFSKQVLPSVR